MTITEAIRLAKSGHKVRPICWRDINPYHWLESRELMGEVVFVECGAFEEMPHALTLFREGEFLGEWEVVE